MPLPRPAGTGLVPRTSAPPGARRSSWRYSAPVHAETAGNAIAALCYPLYAAGTSSRQARVRVSGFTSSCSISLAFAASMLLLGRSPHTRPTEEAESTCPAPWLARRPPPKPYHTQRRTLRGRGVRPAAQVHKAATCATPRPVPPPSQLPLTLPRASPRAEPRPRRAWRRRMALTRARCCSTAPLEWRRASSARSSSAPPLSPSSSPPSRSRRRRGDLGVGFARKCSGPLLERL
eukprot:scaffold4099_cov403-Prasinococcus_capsulatus_cf.AAC.7